MSVELGLIVLRLPPGAFFSRMSAMNFVVGFGTQGGRPCVEGFGLLMRGRAVPELFLPG